LSVALPAGTVTAVAVLASYGVARQQHSSPDQARTTAMLVTIVVSLWILVLASRPLRAWKVGHITGVAGAFLRPGISSFFNIEHWPGPSVASQGIGFGMAACAVIIAVVGLGRRWAEPRQAH
jgi:hypothetical protein